MNRPSVPSPPAWAIQPGFRLFTSNRMERLAGRLCQVLALPLEDPLASEIIVVQSKGMQRWLSLEIASRLAICANMRFPFPNAILAELFDAVLETTTDLTPFQPRIMTWRILKHIQESLDRPPFEALRRYLGEEEHPAKPLQLAHRLASLFDQYLVYRPDVILGWEAGMDEQWQAQLWRALIEDGPSFHQTSLRKALLDRLSGDEPFSKRLPQRLFIFGISALPPFHMEVFRAVSRFAQVNLFFLNPCCEYWADIQSDRQVGRALRGRRLAGSESTYWHMEAGNRLLASQGKIGQDFFRLIQELDPLEEEDFDDPGDVNLLAAVQSDILHLSDRTPENRLTLSSSDRSIEIHSCHSPMRELEVLHDQLLALLEEHPELGPKDILVMTPDIHLYAPYIQAVFGSQEDPHLRIPFTITDRSLHRENRIADGFLALLELPTTRFTPTRVLAFLEIDPVRARFGIHESELEIIRRWTGETGIRWGIDDHDRARLGFAPSLANTWREGLDRLVLGYALRGRDEILFCDVLPLDSVEGSHTDVLDRLLSYIQTIEELTMALRHARSLETWRETLIAMLDTLFEPDPATERDLLSLRLIVEDLAETQRASGFDRPVSLEALRYWLTQVLETSGGGLGFITGGVTFCAMLPMRAIPFPVICLIGMSDGAFPRPDRRLAFDLIAQTPRRGDRSQRGDDRYLFLESILSARLQLYISYVGQSQEDNSSIPPSVLVCELLDTIERTARLPEERKSVLNHILTLHPLQPFSSTYFKGDVESRYFSYSDENCAAAASLRQARMQTASFIETRLPEPESTWRQVELFDLAAFFSSPSKFLLNRRLQIQLELQSLALADSELFVLEGLESYGLQDRLMRKGLEGRDLSRYFPIARAAGVLPHGSVGRSSYSMLSSAMEGFITRLRPYIEGMRQEPTVVEASLGPYLLSGPAGPISMRGLVHYRPAAIKARDRLRLWLHHLVLLCAPDLDWTRTSLFIGRDAGLEYPPVDDAPQWLEVLLDLYWQGLSMPLPFFPETSLACTQAILKGKSDREALLAARGVWDNPFAPRSEMEDPYAQLCFGDEAPLDQQFLETARTVFEPMLTHGREFK